MDKLKNMKKTTKNNIITYALVIAAFVIMQSLINAGSISSLLEGLMVPLCIYIIMAVSLNLVVGVLGELSLGHAGFMCVGAFASAFFSKCMRDTIESASLRFFLALLIGIAAVILPIVIKSGSVRSVLTKSLSVFVTYIMAFAVSISSGLSAYVFRTFFADVSSPGSDGVSGVMLIIYQLVLGICFFSTFIPVLAVCSDKEKAAGNQF